MNDKKITFSDLNSTIIFGYDRKREEFVHIDDCDNGLSCGLFCYFCKNPLNAKNHCFSKSNHFAHKAGSDCRQGHESTLPLLFKKVITENKKIHLPDYHCPNDFSISKSYGFVDIKSVDLEKYDEDLSFNVIIETTDGKRIAIIPYMKSADLYHRENEAVKKYEYVLVVSFESYKNTNFIVENEIKRFVLNGKLNNHVKWIKNKDLSELNELYNAKKKEELALKEKEELALKKKREEAIKAEKEARIRSEQNKKAVPVIDDGVTYYRLKDISTLAKGRKSIKIEHKLYGAKYYINFEEEYTSDDGRLMGRQIDENGNISNRLEIINYLNDSKWREL